MKIQKNKFGETLVEVERVDKENFSFTPRKVCKIGTKYVYIDKGWGYPQPVDIDLIDRCIPLRGLNNAYYTSKEEFYKRLKAEEMARQLDEKLDCAYLLGLDYSKLEQMYKEHISNEN